jgi:hypothetical protein
VDIPPQSDLIIILRNLQEQVELLRHTFENKLRYIDSSLAENKRYIEELLPWTLEVYGAISAIANPSSLYQDGSERDSSISHSLG